jgi:hypothetical protein
MAGLRDAVRAYQKLGGDETRAKNRLQAVCRSRGLGDTGRDLYDPELRKPWIARLPEDRQFFATTLGEELDKLSELRQRAEEQVRAESKKHPVVELVQTHPGIGPLRGAVIVAIVVTANRFRTARQFWAYCGLAIVTETSAQWTRSDGRWVTKNTALPRGLNRNRNPWLKNVFKGAAQTVISKMPDHPLYQDYLRRVDAGTRPNLAQLTLARRIAATVLSMWKHNEVYDPKKHPRQIKP